MCHSWIIVKLIDCAIKPVIADNCYLFLFVAHRFFSKDTVNFDNFGSFISFVKIAVITRIEYTTFININGAMIMSKFEVYESKSGYRWRLKAGNGEIVATGEEYDTKAGAKKGCEAVQRAGALQIS